MSENNIDGPEGEDENPKSPKKKIDYTKVKFKRSGNTYSVSEENPQDMSDTLPAGVYILKFHPMMGFWLEIQPLFELPPKLYGNMTKTNERYIKTFLSRPFGTGILLTGYKGSGKTLQAKALANQLVEENKIPVILVNQAYAGEGFNDFISSIRQPAMVFFDEFEKVYQGPNNPQEKLLTILDGTVQTQKLFLFTANDKEKIDNHMFNRPGRIFYLKNYAGLDNDSIEAFVKEKLVNQDHFEEAVSVFERFHQLNFDTMQAVIEECNRYNESPRQVIQHLNVTVQLPGVESFDITVERIKAEANEEITTSQYGAQRLTPSQPFNVAFSAFKLPTDKRVDELTEEELHAVKSSDHSFTLTPNELVVKKPREGVYVYENKGFRIKLKKAPTYEYSGGQWD